MHTAVRYNVIHGEGRTFLGNTNPISSPYQTQLVFQPQQGVRRTTPAAPCCEEYTVRDLFLAPNSQQVFSD